MTRGQAARQVTAALRPLFRRLGAWRGVLVLNHHRIGDPARSPFDRTMWSATADAFDEQVRFLSREAEVIVPDELVAALAQRRGRAVMLTFDDGYRDNHDVAYPILRSHGVPACFFVATGFVDSPSVPWWDEVAWMVRRSDRSVIEPGDWLAAPLDLDDRDHAAWLLNDRYKQLPGERTEAFLDFLAEASGSGRCRPEEAQAEWMTWDMVRELHKGGMAIGGHTVTHPVLSRRSPEEQDAEIHGCAKRLRDELGEPMRAFSYPVGARSSFDAGTRAALERHAVELAFSFYGGYQRAGRLDRYDVPRSAVFAAWSRPDFIATTLLPQAFAAA
ncbi:MAG: polysaccharide deacetylase family protein [Thermoleophilaceae bacterium]